MYIFSRNLLCKQSSDLKFKRRPNHALTSLVNASMLTYLQNERTSFIFSSPGPFIGHCHYSHSCKNQK